MRILVGVPIGRSWREAHAACVFFGCGSGAARNALARTCEDGGEASDAALPARLIAAPSLGELGVPLLLRGGGRLLRGLLPVEHLLHLDVHLAHQLFGDRQAR